MLEHLVDPWAALRDAATLLRPDGRIVVSIPNVAHGSVRLALLQGDWDYTDKGLLDRTHLRFFTLETVCDLLESSDLAIEVLRSTVLDPFAAEEIALDTDRLPATVVEWVRDQPAALDYQYVAVARLLAPGEVRGPRPGLEPVVAYDSARRRDMHTERIADELDERHRMLTVRDHVIGLEATRGRRRRPHRPVAGARQAGRASLPEGPRASSRRSPRSSSRWPGASGRAPTCARWPSGCTPRRPGGPRQRPHEDQE